MLITRKRRCSLSNQFCLTLQSVPLDRVFQFKYLGVIICHNLCWSAHISDIAARSKKIIGLIYRKFYRFCNTITLRKLYLTLVRRILEYCCHIWDPFLSKDIEVLESVQKFAAKVCTKRWHEPYTSLRNSLLLPLLKERRAVLKLTVVYKCLNGLMVMPPNTFAPLTHSSWNLRSHDHFILHQPFAQQVVTYTLVSPTLFLCGTICLYLFITVCLFPLLNLVLRTLSNFYYCRVYFTLAIMMLFVHPMCVYAT